MQLVKNGGEIEKTLNFTVISDIILRCNFSFLVLAFMVQMSDFINKFSSLKEALSH